MKLIDVNSPNYNLPTSLLTPIGAKDLDSIEKHIGKYKFIEGTYNNAIIVDWLPYTNDLNSKIYTLEHFSNIHQPQQVWVTPEFKDYRNVYFNFFSSIKNKDKYVVDHLFNRRLCSIWKFQFIRLIHVDRGVNSSSGRGQENFSVNLMNDKSNYWTKIKDRNVTYADPFDLMKIVNLKIGKKPYDNIQEMFSFWYL